MAVAARAYAPLAMPIPAADLHVLVAGGGVGALEAALALRAQAAHVRLTLLAPEAVFSYRHLAVGEPFGLAGAAAYELQAIADDRGFTFVHDGLERVDADAHAILTHGGARLGYDRLVLALGARPVAVVPGALTFRGPADVAPLAEALLELTTGAPRRVLFAAPTHVAWTLPLYELALMTGTWARQQDLPLDVVLASPERAPLEAFGPRGSEEATALMARAGVTFLGSVTPERVEPDGLRLADGGSVPADRVVALPRLLGRAPAGLPSDGDGFVEVDDLCHVRDVEDVFAVGDMVSGPLKQGGIAGQQADVAATAIAFEAGADVRPEPFQPALRALLLTGSTPLYLRAGGEGAASEASAATWLPHKVATRYLGPYLAAEGPRLAAGSASAGGQDRD
jgi:sulfide:quinone oxidoreductase